MKEVVRRHWCSVQLNFTRIFYPRRNALRGKQPCITVWKWSKAHFSVKLLQNPTQNPSRCLHIKSNGCPIKPLYTSAVVHILQTFLQMKICSICLNGVVSGAGLCSFRSETVAVISANKCTRHIHQIKILHRACIEIHVRSGDSPHPMESRSHAMWMTMGLILVCHEKICWISSPTCEHALTRLRLP